MPSLNLPFMSFMAWCLGIHVLVKVLPIVINYQSSVATCTAQTGSRQLAAQLSQSLSELTAALPMAAKNMVGFDKTRPAKILFSLCYICNY